MHYLPFNAQKWWLWIIDIFIALLFMCVLTCHFLSFYAIFALKFCPILTKDFHCLISNNLRKQNLSNGRFSVTVSFQFGVTFIMLIDLFFNFLYPLYDGFSVIVYLLRQKFFPIYIYWWRHLIYIIIKNVFLPFFWRQHQISLKHHLNKRKLYLKSMCLNFPELKDKSIWKTTKVKIKRNWKRK